MASSKVFALFALLALCAASASATTCSSYLPSMMQPLPLTIFQQQYCTMMQGIMSPQCHCGATCSMTPMPLQPASLQQQRCMSPMMCGIMSTQCQCGAMFPFTQMPMQVAQFQQQSCIPPVMQGMMAPQCQCGAMCQMAMQLPYMYNAAAMVTPTAYGQQFVAGCGC
ncbi:unnamed protein product [Urochloa decumbens]|uniref:Bifunctional inhibitor/plant lipid transfer protein/seed storage helical domain-containing protein n=1 Tax=Urochloa decumbens TaxID=240449 RepID=A0ABC8Y1X3_9POAL